MKQVVVGFGLLIVAVLILFQLARFSHFDTSNNIEWWIAAASILFFIIGVYISRKMFRKEVITEKEIIIEREVIVERPVPTSIDERQLLKTGISKRELEILQLINDGLSNQQIAERLFVSENTIKKHVSSIFLKLDVERRTEAVRKAKELRII
ncbi:MAG: response regulator transcription factor [Chitinophagaceae bacterium]|nr:response regulator transcription factor [Chitinophagaceae bacterium]